jgi:hypothetical protein
MRAAVGDRRYGAAHSLQHPGSTNSIVDRYPRALVRQLCRSDRPRTSKCLKLKRNNPCLALGLAGNNSQ